MTKRSVPVFASLLLCLVVPIAAMLPAKPALAQPAAKKPNIVFVLMDNLGYGEVGVYGGGILRGAPTPRELTIAELLSDQGYATAQFGTAIDLQFNETESAIDTPCRQAHLIRNNHSRQT